MNESKLFDLTRKNKWIEFNIVECLFGLVIKKL